MHSHLISDYKIMEDLHIQYNVHVIPCYQETVEQSYKKCHHKKYCSDNTPLALES